ncbi:exosortase H-associated membrane protein [Dokdonella sp.]|uniref:exosortase H-associated membrane protein n=1 Tax=Dokdonella sp. TaxID=2291710 RepID=UPI0025B9C104|nr:exosortase H-associated membrane protein [Dokdonella sp.]MBX3690816.1 hypothetical protein [Dokdonella sp.]MCW5566597.1 hypothetical protein [Dokdonella sp.]
MRVSPLREFGLKAVLWLPLAFFLWFVLAEALVWPVIRMAGVVLTSLWPDLFGQIGQHGHFMETGTRVLVDQVDAQGRGGIGELVLRQNPMIYGYSLPLFAGLAMAAPLDMGQRLLQFGVAFAAIWLTQSFGLVAESLKLLAFDSGPVGASAIKRAGIPANAIALAYQFGYLILPALMPVALWLGLNRDFVMTLVHPVAEPAGHPPGRSPESQE